MSTIERIEIGGTGWFFEPYTEGTYALWPMGKEPTQPYIFNKMDAQAFAAALQPQGWQPSSDDVLEILSYGEGRIFDVEKTEGGLALTEACDNYFTVKLSAPQVMRLIEQLKGLLPPAPVEGR